MPRVNRFTLALWLLLTSLAQVKAQEPKAVDVSFQPYTLRTFDGREHAAELGKVWVPENRRKPSGRLIQLAFVRLKSTAATPGPPIVFLAGGPGVPGIVMGQVPVYFRLFDRLRQVSDMILLDQRGTGMSWPNLQCKANAALPPDVFENEANAINGLIRSVRACAEHWQSEGVDLAAYNTNENADDLDALRTALGAERLSLLGMSYGTELALVALRRHGEHIERVVLAGTKGPDDAFSLPSTLDLQLRKLSRLAANDPTIGKEVQDLYSLTKQVLEQLERDPVTLTAMDQQGKRKQELRFGRAGLEAVVQRMLGDGRSFPRLPALILTTSRGDYSLLTPIAEHLQNDLNSGISSMTVAMMCSAGWFPEARARAEREAGKALLGNVANLQLRPEVCTLAGNPDLGPEFRSPIWSTVPTLFLSGELDSNTPPFQAEKVRRGLPASTHLIIDFAGHETLPSERVQDVVVDFFKGQDVSSRKISFEPPRFLSIEEAKAH